LAQETETKLREPFVKFFDEAEFLASQFVEMVECRLGKRPWRCRLAVLAQDFGTRFAAAKRDLAGIDFADLGAVALQLLWDAGGQLTPCAREWCGRFEHVFRDE